MPALSYGSTISQPNVNPFLPNIPSFALMQL